jgi:hypothetical protein
MSLVTNVISKVRASVPDGASRYADAFLTRRVYAADCVIREGADLVWADYDISLVANVHHYDLPRSMIAVGTVLYAEDGVNFDDGELKPATVRDFDGNHYRWSEVRGSEPCHYALLGCPGSVGSKIIIYPALSTVSAHAIRVKHLSCHDAADADFLSFEVQGWVEDEVYVPHVMSQLCAGRGGADFDDWWRRYSVGLMKLRGVSADHVGEPVRDFDGPSLSGGQL